MNSGHGYRSGRWFPALVASGLLIALPACKPPAEAPAKVETGPLVLGSENLTVVQKATVQTGPQVAGSLQPRRQAMVRAKVGGSVEWIGFDLGQVVKEGALLARIDAAALRDVSLSAKAGLESAVLERTLAVRQQERTEKLVAAGALSERDLELARSAVIASDARLNEARSRLASANEQLSSVTVRAPIQGVVSNRAVSEGDVVAPGTLLYTIIDPTSMRLEASVPSEQLSDLTIGAEVEFTVRGVPGRTFAGQLERIAPAADPATRQIPILVSIPNRDGKLLAGLFAEGRLSSQKKEALVVPFDAIAQIGEASSVKRITNGVVEEVQVQTGLRDEQAERVEIVAGLQPGDQVLIGTARDVAPGTAIRVTAPQSTSSH